METSRREPRVGDGVALLLRTSEEFVVRTLNDTSTAISQRVEGLVPHSARELRWPIKLQRGVSQVAYGATSVGLRAGAGVLSELSRRGVTAPLERGPRSRFVRSASNGLMGDSFQHREDPMAITMAVRHAGADVPLTDEGLAAAFDQATDELVVFVHGLCENESYWNLDWFERQSTYADELSERGWTPLMIRYNSGISLRENGVALSSLLEQVVAAWPIPVRRIALIGHSMGGLVIRTATGVQAQSGPAGWTLLVSDVVTLGTPHLGAPLARAIHRGSTALKQLPETAALAEMLDRRAGSIDELIDGLGEEVPPIPGVNYRLVSATLGESPTQLVSRALGDLLVHPASAYGRLHSEDPHLAPGEAEWRELFAGAQTLHVGAANHLDLLNHTRVAEALLEWLCATSEQGA